MEYILFIHKNTNAPATKAQWAEFIEAANQAGLFLGGSEIADRTLLGDKPVTDVTDSIGGFMRFEAEDKNALLTLLKKHPVAIQGGTLELCEMPKS